MADYSLDSLLKEGGYSHDKAESSPTVDPKSQNDDYSLNSLLKEGGYKSQTQQAEQSPLAKPKEPTFLQNRIRDAKDLGVEVLKGGVSAGQGVVGLADLATGGAAGSALSKIGYDSARTNEAINSLHSDNYLQGQRAVEEAGKLSDTDEWENARNTVGALIDNPMQAVGSAVESIPMMLPGMGLQAGIAKKAALLGAEKIAGGVALDAAGNKIITAAGQEAANKAILAATPKIITAGAAMEGTQQAGSLADTAQQSGKDWSDYAAPAVVSGIADALIAKGSGKLLGDVATSVITRNARNGLEKGIEGNMAGRFLKGAAEEGLAEELPQSWQEQVMQNKAMGEQNQWKGTGAAGVQGAVAGGLMGGVMNVGALSKAAAAGGINTDVNQNIITPEQIAAAKAAREAQHAAQQTTWIPPTDETVADVVGGKQTVGELKAQAAAAGQTIDENALHNDPAITGINPIVPGTTETAHDLYRKLTAQGYTDAHDIVNEALQPPADRAAPLPTEATPDTLSLADSYSEIDNHQKSIDTSNAEISKIRAAISANTASHGSGHVSNEEAAKTSNQLNNSLKTAEKFKADTQAKLEALQEQYQSDSDIADKNILGVHDSYNSDSYNSAANNVNAIVLSHNTTNPTEQITHNDLSIESAIKPDGKAQYIITAKGRTQAERDAEISLKAPDATPEQAKVIELKQQLKQKLNNVHPNNVIASERIAANDTATPSEVNNALAAFNLPSSPIGDINEDKQTLANHLKEIHSLSTEINNHAAVHNALPEDYATHSEAVNHANKANKSNKQFTFKPVKHTDVHGNVSYHVIKEAINPKIIPSSLPVIESIKAAITQVTDIDSRNKFTDTLNGYLRTDYPTTDLPGALSKLKTQIHSYVAKQELTLEKLVKERRDVVDTLAKLKFSPHDQGIFIAELTSAQTINDIKLILKDIRNHAGLLKLQSDVSKARQSAGLSAHGIKDSQTKADRLAELRTAFTVKDIKDIHAKINHHVRIESAEAKALNSYQDRALTYLDSLSDILDSDKSGFTQDIKDSKTPLEVGRVLNSIKAYAQSQRNSSVVGVLKGFANEELAVLNGLGADTKLLYDRLVAATDTATINNIRKLIRESVSAQNKAQAKEESATQREQAKKEREDKVAQNKKDKENTALSEAQKEADHLISTLPFEFTSYSQSVAEAQTPKEVKWIIDSINAQIALDKVRTIEGKKIADVQADLRIALDGINEDSTAFSEISQEIDNITPATEKAAIANIVGRIKTETPANAEAVESNNYEKNPKTRRKNILNSLLDNDGDIDKTFSENGFINIDGFWVAPTVAKSVKSLKEKTKEILRKNGLVFIDDDIPEGAAGLASSISFDGESIFGASIIGEAENWVADHAVIHELGHAVFFDLPEDIKELFYTGDPLSKHGYGVKNRLSSHASYGDGHTWGDEDFADAFYENDGDIDALIAKKKESLSKAEAVEKTLTPLQNKLIEKGIFVPRNRDLTNSTQWTAYEVNPDLIGQVSDSVINQAIQHEKIATVSNTVQDIFGKGGFGYGDDLIEAVNILTDALVTTSTERYQSEQFILAAVKKLQADNETEALKQLTDANILTTNNKQSHALKAILSALKQEARNLGLGEFDKLGNKDSDYSVHVQLKPEQQAAIKKQAKRDTGSLSAQELVDSALSANERLTIIDRAYEALKHIFYRIFKAKNTDSDINYQVPVQFLSPDGKAVVTIQKKAKGFKFYTENDLRAQNLPESAIADKLAQIAQYEQLVSDAEKDDSLRYQREEIKDRGIPAEGLEFDIELLKGNPLLTVYNTLAQNQAKRSAFKGFENTDFGINALFKDVDNQIAAVKALDDTADQFRQDVESARKTKDDTEKDKDDLKKYGVLSKWIENAKPGETREYRGVTLTMLDGAVKVGSSAYANNSDKSSGSIGAAVSKLMAISEQGTVEKIISDNAAKLPELYESKAILQVLLSGAIGDALKVRNAKDQQTRDYANRFGNKPQNPDDQEGGITETAKPKPPFNPPLFTAENEVGNGYPEQVGNEFEYKASDLPKVQKLKETLKRAYKIARIAKGDAAIKWADKIRVLRAELDVEQGKAGTFTPTHELENGTQVELVKDDLNGDYWLESDGTEYGVNDYKATPLPTQASKEESAKFMQEVEKTLINTDNVKSKLYQTDKEYNDSVSEEYARIKARQDSETTKARLEEFNKQFELPPLEQLTTTPHKNKLLASKAIAQAVKAGTITKGEYIEQQNGDVWNVVKVEAVPQQAELEIPKIEVSEKQASPLKPLLDKAYEDLKQSLASGRNTFAKELSKYNAMAEAIGEPTITEDDVRNSGNPDLIDFNRMAQTDYEDLPLADNGIQRLIQLPKAKGVERKVVEIDNDYVLVMDGNRYLDLPELTEQQAIELSKTRTDKNTGEKQNQFFDVYPRAYVEHLGFKRVTDTENLLGGKQPQFSKATPNQNTHTQASLTAAFKNQLDSKFGEGWTNRLLATGKFEIQTLEQAQADNPTLNLAGVQGFYDAKTDRTIFIAENISKDKDLAGLALHEVATHALELGKSSAEFMAIMNDLARSFNRPAVKEAIDTALKSFGLKEIPKQDRPIDGVSREDVLHEIGAYLLEKNPTLSVSQKLVQWFRKAVRAIGKVLPLSDRVKWFKWANTLTEADIIDMATSALRAAPESLLFDSVGRNKESSNILASYAGQRAANADKSALAKAVEMEQQGIDSEAIRKETGWFLGMDDKWRFEIPDNEAELIHRPVNTQSMSLPNVLKHDSLFENYPFLNEVRVLIRGEKNPDYWAAYYNPTENHSGYIKVIDNSISDDDFLSILLHEIQHGIQTEEGFARGGNEETSREDVKSLLKEMRTINIASPERINQYEKSSEIVSTIKAARTAINSFDIWDRNPESIRKYSQWHRFGRGITRKKGEERTNDLNEVIEKSKKDWLKRFNTIGVISESELREYANSSERTVQLREYGKILRAFDKDYPKFREKLYQQMKKADSFESKVKHDSNFRLYLKLAGEIEARDTQARMGMDAAQRKESTPYVSQGISKEDAIVRFDSGIAESRTEQPDTKQLFADLDQYARNPASVRKAALASLEGNPNKERILYIDKNIHDILSRLEKEVDGFVIRC